MAGHGLFSASVSGALQRLTACHTPVAVEMVPMDALAFAGGSSLERDFYWGRPPHGLSRRLRMEKAWLEWTHRM